MSVDAAEITRLLRGLTDSSYGSIGAARRLIDDQFRAFWYYYARYIDAIASRSPLRVLHHALGSVLQPLTNGRLYALDEELRGALAVARGEAEDWTVATVRAFMAPLEELSAAAIAETEERLGPVPPIESVPLVDIDWLVTLARTGRVPEKVGETKVGEVAVASVNMQERIVACGDAIIGHELETANRIRGRAYLAARICRAIRVMTALRDLEPSLLAGDASETLVRLADLRRALDSTLAEIQTTLTSRDTWNV